MIDSRTKRAAEIQDSIRQILYREWDPIGVSQSAPEDEYDSYMKRFLILFLLTVGLVFGALSGLPLLIGVWLPDVISAREHTVAEQRLASGHSFRVVQYWNRVDFYSTELRVTSPDGSTETHTLDGDDSKSWRLPLVIDEQRHTATVTLGGGRVRKIDWK